MRRTSADRKFALVLGHADEASLLRQCVQHHLAIGIQNIVVVLNNNAADTAALEVAAEFAGDDRVLMETMDILAPGRGQEWQTPATEYIREHMNADWVLYADSDEFWLPASGKIDDIDGLDDARVVSVARFNSPPIRSDDGTISWAAPVTLDTPIFGDPQISATDFEIAPEANPAWIRTRVGPKVLARTEDVGFVSHGGHAILARTLSGPSGPEIPAAHATNAVIVHLPFTTVDRFRKKIDGIRNILGLYAHYLVPGQAAHWWRWLEVDAEGLTDREFALQTVDQSELPALFNAGVLTTPAQYFAQRRSVATV